jgi:hypothetical protein
MTAMENSMPNAAMVARAAAPDLHGISREAFDEIVNSETSGRKSYELNCRRPIRPGGASGITVGIGYDCGYSSAATICADWGGKIAPAMVDALASVAGLTGRAAQAQLGKVRPLVLIEWDAAIAVFCETSLPKYLALTRKALPNFDLLPPSCRGVLTSLVYNRGASFSAQGARYQEMRAIKAHMIAKVFDRIPAELRKMKRLWTAPAVRGVALRREREARLFEAGLAGKEKAPEQALV